MKTIQAHPTVNNGVPSWRICIPEQLRAQEKAGRKFVPDNRLQPYEVTVTDPATGEQVQVTKCRAPRGVKPPTEVLELINRLNGDRQSWSRRLTAMPDTDQGLLVTALELVKWDVRELLNRLQNGKPVGKASKEILLAQAIQDYMAAKRVNGDSKHLRQVEALLGKMLIGFESKNCSEFTQKHWFAFLDRKTEATPNGWSNTTKANVFGALTGFWNWAEAQGYCQSPLAGLAKPEPDAPPKQWFSIEQIAALLRKAAEIDPDMVSYFALGIFAGLRPEFELMSLSETMRIDDHFALPDSITKTGLRNARISPILEAWLARFPKIAGWVNSKKRRLAIAKAAGIEWPFDGMRHTFCTYEVPVFQADGTTFGLGYEIVSQNAGHSVAVLKKHYCGKLPMVEVKRWHSELYPDQVLAGLNITAQAA